MPKRKNKKVKNKNQIRQNITNRKSVKEDFRIVLENENWLRTCKIDKENFTNMYSDYRSLAKTLTKVMTELLPDIEKNGYDIFNKQNIYYSRTAHCHLVDKSKFEIVQKIVNEINDRELDIFSDEEKKLWQYGITGGIRIICIYDQANNNVHPLFIDPHHLIHSSIKYNQQDVMTNHLCPVKTFNENSFE
ncbi:hypothetical protein [Staphylococcus kloosii]|uniref:Phage protein n=1 Tax=Staphylococcus kloosii TaxID=29384 RepID=A0ABQ0XMH7_9STAP|nr:hypothetical protein [Staphylococcus kloosii]AVQ35813.1 hypothetical protein C7J89_06605 [Staphylococcus kloosii]PNZ05412.1 hypothetical protein CD136_07090 [Staphylococcus kloosii]GEP82580.1 hypothetical protein SKL01_17580 [Staphylococcus kloosii]SUM48882.1 Uncharacterised protein [Staphylococcus kloosii]